MTEKELLELAAKAAEIDGWYEQGYLTFIARGKGPWRPLDDDSDAFRLAVKLGLTVEVLSKRMEPHSRVNGKEEEHRADPYAATRRAIVRAAAEIGRTL